MTFEIGLTLGIIVMALVLFATELARRFDRLNCTFGGIDHGTGVQG